MGGNGRVSGKAAGVGVLRVDVGGAGDVEGLDVKEREGLRSVKTPASRTCGADDSRPPELTTTVTLFT